MSAAHDVLWDRAAASSTLPEMTDDPTDEARGLREWLLTANLAYVESFDGADAPKRPARRLFVLTCMDARVEPLRLLGLGLGDAHVVRNAGGRVSDDAVRSLVLSSALLGTTHAVVIHHTDCGLGMTSDDQVRSDLRDAGVDVGNLWIGAFADVDHSVRDDVDTLRSHPLVADRVAVTGYVYDVRTGHLRPVEST